MPSWFSTEVTFLYRKKIEANGLSDHTIVDDDMHVIWAVGQVQCVASS